MKKIIYSILTLSLILTGSLSVTSCGSDDSTTTVTPNPEPEDNEPQTQTLVVTASATSGYLGDVITLSATLDGAAITSGVTYYVDDVAISGNTLTSDVEADLLVSAKYQNVTSDYVTVSFEENPFLDIEGVGNYSYNGTNVVINGALLRAINAFPDGNGGYTIWWIQEGWTGNNPSTSENYIAVSFDTPAVVENNQLVSYELPGANMNTYYSIETALINGQLMVSDQFTGGTGVVTYNAFDGESNPATADFNISVTGTHNILFNYVGDISPVASARAKSVKGNKHNLQIKSLKDKELVKQELLNKILKK
ncbi:hypothetical protein [Flavobacterium sp. I3-2]|uniref:hypothetical protein n=1 Tax=Flavobacterium sp. I3-2 TaxID=2748319 RepID=UPI0015B318C3|nr:hypothetical protein [Flavobacterium sp. I3-2]